MSETLAARLARVGRLSAREVQALAVTLCEALEALHGARRLHLAVNPWTVLLTDDGGAELSGAGSTQYEPYAAPECFTGGGPSPQTDLYALGATLHQALTGAMPPTVAEREAGADVEVVLSGVSEGLMEAIGWALSLEDRPQTARELLGTLAPPRVVATGTPPGLDGAFLTVPTDHSVQPAVLAGHAGRVWSVAFSPDGRLLASTGEDATVRFWDPGTAQQVGQFAQYRGPEVQISDFKEPGRAGGNAVAFSTDGGSIAAGAWAASIIYGMATGAVNAPPNPHPNAVRSVAFHPQWPALLTACYDRRIRLWEIASGRLVWEASGHTGPVYRAVFTPDGATVASCSADRTIRLWDAATGRPMATLAGHGAEIMGLAVSPVSRLLASASNDETIRLWDLATGQTLHVLKGHFTRAVCVAFSPDGRLLASGGDDNDIRLWEVATGRCLCTLGEHDESVISLAWHPGGQLIASASFDQSVRLCSLQ